jgi:hypothetical protein
MATWMTIWHHQPSAVIIKITNKTRPEGKLPHSFSIFVMRPTGYGMRHAV